VRPVRLDPPDYPHYEYERQKWITAIVSLIRLELTVPPYDHRYPWEIIEAIRRAEGQIEKKKVVIRRGFGCQSTWRSSRTTLIR
jgi:hypothetical protein